MSQGATRDGAVTRHARPLARFGLGTAQFGMPYGAFNRSGMPSHDEVGAILRRAAALGLSTVDTASAYGESEAVLGAWSTQLAEFDVITKTPVFSDEAVTPADARVLRDACARSLDRLQCSAIGGVLVHHGSNLLAHGGEHLYEELIRIKEEGLVRRIGVSAYSGDVVERILERFPIDIVQLPVNLLDRRLIHGGTLARLADAGVEIHARSAFLQGLLLADPAALTAYFAPVRDTLAAFHAAAHEAGVRPAHAALHFVSSMPEISRVIVGVESLAQLEDLFGTFPADIVMDYSAVSTDDVDILDPWRWPTPAPRDVAAGRAP